jgi:tRNA pseudouridine38-40 synthase
MVRYFIKLAYDGTKYHGWQIQENANTVQAELEQKISIMLGKSINVVGCGRTDTGVHAREYFAHFDIEKLPFDENDLTYKLNRFLPSDISIYKIFKVNSNIHARFSAISRSYSYYINKMKNPFTKLYSYHHPAFLNIDKMNKAASFIMDYNDFTSFSKLHTQTATNICNVTEAYWEIKNDVLIFNITADRFLRNMVRAIVGTLLEIGKGKLESEEIKTIIEMKNRQKAGFSAPAHGLFLNKVKYTFVID